MVTRQPNESVEHLIKRFKKEFQESGTLRELKKREYYRSPSQKRKEKRAEAEKRRRKYSSSRRVEKDY